MGSTHSRATEQGNVDPYFYTNWLTGMITMTYLHKISFNGATIYSPYSVVATLMQSVVLGTYWY